MFKSGYIAILGAPNVGKSTLLNAILGEKLAIVSDKPQTTRQKLLGIHNIKGTQLLFLDTPGLHKAEKMLNQFMVNEALSALQDADLIYFLVEPHRKPSAEQIEFLKEADLQKKPYFLVINKVDKVSKPDLLPIIQEWSQACQPREIFPVSAKSGDGVQELVERSCSYLPEGPAYYPEDQMTDRDLRYLSAEIIREKLFRLTHQEIPYSTAVVIDEFKEDTTKPLDRITATIYVEKDSQKPIVIGQKGSMLKQVGQEARLEIEALTGRKVFLTLFVKVVKDWTKRDSILKDLGYQG